MKIALALICIPTVFLHVTHDMLVTGELYDKRFVWSPRLFFCLKRSREAEDGRSYFWSLDFVCVNKLESEKKRNKSES